MATLAQQRFYEFGEFQLDAGRRLLLRAGDVVALTPKAFDILLILVRNRGRVVEKDELMRLVWPGTVVEENNLTRNISSLRKALAEGPNDHRFIVTVPGRGYQFAAVIPLAMPLPDGAVKASDHLPATKREESESSVVSPSVLHLNGGRNPRTSYCPRHQGVPAHALCQWTPAGLSTRNLQFNHLQLRPDKARFRSWQPRCTFVQGTE